MWHDIFAIVGATVAEASNYIILASILAILSRFIFMGLLNWLTKNALMAELGDTKVWRPQSDPRCWYALTVVDVVNAVVLFILAKHVLPQLVSQPNEATYISLALIYWALTSGHGIFIDYMSMKMSFILTVALLAQCCGAIVIQAYLLPRYLQANHSS